MNSPGSYSERTFCPQCGDKVRLEDVKVSVPFTCRHCGTFITVSPLYRIIVVALSFVASLLLSYAFGVRAYAVILLVPLFLISLSLLPNLGKTIIPPTLQAHTEPQGPVRKEERWRRHLRMFVAFWFGLTVYFVAYGFFTGWLAFFVGGSNRDVQETIELWSLPLGWLNSAFVITPGRSILAVFGIVFANSFFHAGALTFVVQVVKARLRQQRVTQLAIFSRTSDDSDEEGT